jgi:hypothetical protein
VTTNHIKIGMTDRELQLKAVRLRKLTLEAIVARGFHPHQI